MTEARIEHVGAKPVPDLAPDRSPSSPEPIAMPGLDRPTYEVEDGGLLLVPREEPPLPEGYRRCPTLAGLLQPMLRQVVDEGQCRRNQEEGFHKCAGCVHREAPLWSGDDLAPPDNGPSALTRARAERSPR